MPPLAGVEDRLNDEHTVAGLEAHDLGDVQHVVGVLQADGDHGVVVLLLFGDREVAGDEDVGGGQTRQRRAAELVLREVGPIVGHRVLLVQRGPEARRDRLLDPVELGQVVALRVQRAALGAQEAVAGAGAGAGELGAVRRRGAGVLRVVEAGQWSHVVLDQIRLQVQELVVLGHGRVLHELELVGLQVVGHGHLEPAGEVVVVPPGLDDQHAAAGG